MKYVIRKSFKLALVALSFALASPAIAQRQLEVAGKITLMDDDESDGSQPGDMRWNSSANGGMGDFEGFFGEQWHTFTNSAEIVTKYKSFDGALYYSASSGFLNVYTGSYVIVGDGIGGEIRMALDLPHGSTVKSFKISYWDNSASNYQIDIIRSEVEFNQGIRAVPNTTGTTSINDIGWKFLTVDVSDFVVDNEDYAYILRIKATSGGTFAGYDARFGPISFEYEE